MDDEPENMNVAHLNEEAAHAAWGHTLQSCISVDWTWLQCHPDIKKLLQSCDRVLLPAGQPAGAHPCESYGCLSEAQATNLNKQIFNCLKLHLQAPFHQPEDTLPVRQSKNQILSLFS